ncbi:unnamed protein product [Ilex paraguariensis]|uniref:Uncharacterized protein n=1 Tax=Ilex paraguariensis TaxID=185542 RepID=A0ABC8UX98_9AQUA
MGKTGLGKGEDVCLLPGNDRRNQQRSREIRATWRSLGKGRSLSSPLPPIEEKQGIAERFFTVQVNHCSIKLWLGYKKPSCSSIFSPSSKVWHLH